MKPAGLQGPDDPVGIDATDGRDLGPGDGLLVGHDGERFEGGGRHAAGLALEHEALDVGSHLRMTLEAVPARHPNQLETPVFVAVSLGQLPAQVLDPRRRDLEQLGQEVRVDGLISDHDDRLDGLGLL